MLGALIGDLAADTWQRDKAAMYRQLIDGNALPSAYGVAVMKASRIIFEKKEISLESIKRDYLDEMMHGDDPIYNKTASWTKEYFTGDRYKAMSEIGLILFGLCGWANNDANEAKKQALRIKEGLHIDKDGWYAANILPVLVCRLRNGDSKNEALLALEQMFGQITLNWNKQNDDVLGAIARAWDAFYRAFDFTSAIHSAVKSPVNPELTATIAGMLADAMYGCEQGFLKKKYTDNFVFYISCPRKELSDNWYALKKMRENVRLFFPKNRALTNVERHEWSPIFNPFEGMHFNEELLHRIRMALDTGWENRYGIYLDDGWYYVYRSHSLLNRFRIKCENERYVIVDVQRSNDPHANDWRGLIAAISSIEWPPFTRMEDCKLFLSKSPACRCRYYKGEKENPFDMKKERSKARFWHGEMMYLKMLQPDLMGRGDHWINRAKEIRKNLKGAVREKAKKYSDEDLAILFFIEALFQKWCPMEEDWEWLWEY